MKVSFYLYSRFTVTSHVARLCWWQPVKDNCLSCRGSLCQLSVRLRGRRAPSPQWRPGWECSSPSDPESFRKSVFTTEEWDRPPSAPRKPALLSSRSERCFLFLVLISDYSCFHLSSLNPSCLPQALGWWDPRPGLRRPPGWAGPPSFGSWRKSGVSSLFDSQPPLQIQPGGPAEAQRNGKTRNFLCN